ncbi:CoA pyrophosphatase [Thalassotalea euphylliae]|uniref:CoA pyrophosphatase n=1 Tax=Thalassotalea euphylliae TaxID=1655234 RepID=UPI0036301119
MNKAQFLNRFHLFPLAPSQHKFKFADRVKAAAVLIPLVETERGLDIVFTRRADHLKHHPGQISFPGGKVEKQDANYVETALREAHEEIALNPEQVDVLGQLEPYHTITGYQVTPIIGLISGELALQADEQEVAEIFTVPLSFFVDHQNHLKVSTFHKGKKHHVYFMPYKHYNIWGATAAMLADLVAHIHH